MGEIARCYGLPLQKCKEAERITVTDTVVMAEFDVSDAPSPCVVAGAIVLVGVRTVDETMLTAQGAGFAFGKMQDGRWDLSHGVGGGQAAVQGVNSFAGSGLFRKNVSVSGGKLTIEFSASNTNVLLRITEQFSCIKIYNNPFGS